MEPAPGRRSGLALHHPSPCPCAASLPHGGAIRPGLTIYRPSFGTLLLASLLARGNGAAAASDGSHRFRDQIHRFQQLTGQHQIPTRRSPTHSSGAPGAGRCWNRPIAIWMRTTARAVAEGLPLSRLGLRRAGWRAWSNGLVLQLTGWRSQTAQGKPASSPRPLSGVLFTGRWQVMPLESAVRSLGEDQPAAGSWLPP